MATAPPPYSEHPSAYPENPPVNPNYAVAGYQQHPPAHPGFVDPSKGAQVGYPAQPGYPPQQTQPGYPPAQYPPPQMQPAMASPPQQQTIVIQQGPVVTGNCPICRAGNVTHDFTCCGICLAIFCFPLGLICCFLMRERHCTRCGARV